MSDLFHKDVPDSFILDVFKTMLSANQHIYQVLTKRPSRLVNTGLAEKITQNIFRLTGSSSWPTHIWLGVSIETSTYAWHADALRKVPASVRTPPSVGLSHTSPRVSGQIIRIFSTS